MPKQRITKEMIVEAAFQLARAGGMEEVMVKNIAEKLECSVQPIYSYCKNMDGLRQEVIERTGTFIKDYLATYINKSEFFRSMGHTYIQLAKEEPHIFQIFVFHKREKINSLSDLYSKESNPKIVEFIADDLKISCEKAKKLHLNMLIYTVGIGTIIATSTPGIPKEEILLQLESAYRVFLQEALQE